LVLMPHGGPNAVHVTDYFLPVAAIALSGFAVALVNFTGSIGFGSAAVKALEGRIGELDVGDCLAALDAAEDHFHARDMPKIVFGGSHGGFLAAHLSSRHGQRFNGAILRNPVVDLPGMALTSDIGDWPAGQMGLSFDLLKPRALTAEEHVRLIKASPLPYADQVRCPSLILLGGRDLRVPPSQGLSWYRAITGTGKAPADLYVFPEANHDLNEHAESDNQGLRKILSFLDRVVLPH